jgi:Protein of unknown function (DUF2924)
MTDRLRREIDGLHDLTRQELVERWQKAHGCLPPKGIKRNLLLHSAAWHLQAQRLGGIKGDAKRTLRQLIKPGCAVSQSEAPRSDKSAPSGTRPVRQLRGRLSPGARLVREWNGRLHVVEVVDNGFVHDGKTYRSLTAVAQRITGTTWSGPRFFGL